MKPNLNFFINTYFKHDLYKNKFFKQRYYRIYKYFPFLKFTKTVRIFFY